MARLRTVVTTEGEIATGTAAKTLLQIVAPANQKIAFRAFSISFDGTSSSAAPIMVELVRQTSAGTMTAATVRKEDGSAETPQMTAQKNATVEPTDGGEVLRSYNVHPQTGAEWKFSVDEEILVPGGGRLGLRVTAGASVGALAHMSCEE